MSTDTKEAILSVARSMAQAHGYGGLNFRDIASEVGIKSASLHYHFPTKADLATALARRYADDAERILDGLLAKSEEPAVLVRGLTDVFREALVNDNRMCLYGILSAERDELSDEVRAELDRFAEVNIRWLTKVLSLENAKKTPDERKRRAVAIFAAVEGAQLVSRSRGDVTIYDAILKSYRAAGLLP